MRRWNGVRARLQHGHEPEAGDALWRRIAAARAHRGTVVLPHEPHRARVGGGFALVLLCAALTAYLAWPRLPAPAAEPGPSLDWGSPLMPRALLAQSGQVRHLPAILPPDGRRLRPGRWVYVWTLGRGREAGQDPAQAIADTVTIRPGDFKGEPAWLVTLSLHRTQGRGTGRLDSLYLRRSDLQPLREALFWARPDRLETAMVTEADLSRGTLRWRYRIPGGAGRDTTVTLRLPSGNGTAWRGGGAWSNQLPILLGGLGLEKSWSGGVPLLLPRTDRAEPDSTVALGWMDLRVSGRKMVTVPAGRFDCWLVTLTFPPDGEGESAMDFWVDVRTGALVREDPGKLTYLSRARELAAILP